MLSLAKTKMPSILCMCNRARAQCRGILSVTRINASSQRKTSPQHFTRNNKAAINQANMSNGDDLRTKSTTNLSIIPAKLEKQRKRQSAREI